MTKRLRWLVTVAAAAVVLVCAGGIYVSIRTFKDVNEPASAAAQRQLDKYLQAIEDDRWDDAYGSLCAEYQAVLSRTAHRERYGPTTDYVGHEFVGEPERVRLGWQGPLAWKFQVRERAAHGQTVDWWLYMKSEDDRWTVCTDVSGPQTMGAR